MLSDFTPAFPVFALVLGVAVVTDLRDRRIPNVVTVTGLCAAVLLEAVFQRAMPASALAGAGFALVLGFALFALGGIGAGDAKLFAAVGAFVGPQGVLVAVIYGGLAGGVIVLVDAWRHGRVGALWTGTRDVLVNLLTLGHLGQRRTLSSPGAHALPYGVAIAIGGLAAWFLPLPGGAL